MIFQSISQLKNRYENDVWQELLGNCDTKLVFGCNEIMSAQYVSDLLGIATVETSGIKKNAGFDGKLTMGKESISTVKRNLINPDELIKFDNKKLIAIVRGKKPFICNKLDYAEHPLSNEMEEIVIEEHKEKVKIEHIKKEKVDEPIKELPTFDKFILKGVKLNDRRTRKTDSMAEH